MKTDNTDVISKYFFVIDSGMQTGTIVSLPLSGVLADSSFLGILCFR